MNSSLKCDRFLDRLQVFQPRQDQGTRALALYSAAIAIADETTLDRAIEIGRTMGLKRREFYEIVLQSYLFLGFPRMLQAADHLDRHFPAPGTDSDFCQFSAAESESWYSNGLSLCRQIYGDAYEPLKHKVRALAPEVFRWMVIEGYGKVLSRPGLSIIDRELAIVACLMMENYPRQLFSHIRGAINVGTVPALVRTVIEDIGRAAGEGYATSVSILKRLGM
ncbi:MAG: hypothetical protein ABII79_02455 [bacterium]